MTHSLKIVQFAIVVLDHQYLAVINIIADIVDALHVMDAVHIDYIKIMISELAIIAIINKDQQKIKNINNSLLTKTKKKNGWKNTLYSRKNCYYMDMFENFVT